MKQFILAFEIPEDFKTHCSSLLQLVQDNPNKIQVWDVKSHTLKMTLRYVHSDTLVSIFSGASKGMCGVYPIVKWIKAKQVRLLLGTKEITFKDLK